MQGLRHRRRRAGFVAGALIVAIVSSGAAAMVADASAQPLGGPQIEQAIGGKRVYLATPFGGEFPLNYRAGGVVDGDGEALGLGKAMAPRDKGRWWIDGDRLCQRWQEWYDGKPFCFTLQKTGPRTLRWRRDDGLEGRARIE
jgi:hypothetical protein